MSVGIRHCGVAGIVVHSQVLSEGLWLKTFDPDANDGIGHADWTADPAEAMRFETAQEAMRCWRVQSVVRPLRPDGKPNRPLTAFHVTVEDLP